MKNVNEINKILESHKKWLNNEENGVRADLRDADMSDADMSDADLSGANLFRANLYGADLSGANLSGANLIRANLFRANLSGANLSGANLFRANLYGADLSGANLSDADMSDASLGGAKNIPEYVLAVTSITPEGDLIGWKKCQNDVLVKLLIPASARRSNATSRKCRAEYAVGLEVIGGEFGISKHDENVIYRKGETVHCHEWDEDRWNECSGGIHFFLTRYEAEQY